MERKHRKIKLNNGGMSLVEVIIAITILGIVAVPVLHSLTTSMVYNSKARIRQDMTLKAESIMETFKGYDLKTLQGMFAANRGIEGIQAGTDCTDYTAPAVDFEAGPPTAPIEYSINGLRDNRDKTYDVTITATPEGTKEVLEMRNVDGTKDAVYKGERDYDKEAAKKALDDFRNAHKTEFVDYFKTIPDEEGNPMQAINADGQAISDADVEADTFANYIELYERKITFNISDDGSGNYKVTSRMTYKYYIKDYPYYSAEEAESRTDPYYDEGETAPSVPEMEQYPSQLFYLDSFPEDTASYPEVTIPVSGEDEPEIYSNPKAAGLDRLVVYYYPQYDLGAGHDIIEINNLAGIDKFYCYVIKQRAADINETRTGVFENGYQAKVQGYGIGTVFNLYHNFNVNIGNGSSTATPAITGFTRDASYTESDDFYEDEVLSYNLELVVTDTATGNVVTKFESSMNEKIKVN